MSACSFPAQSSNLTRRRPQHIAASDMAYRLCFSVTRDRRAASISVSLLDLPFQRNSPVPTFAEPSKQTELAADIVAAFVANNSLPIAELPALIHSVHAVLATLGGAPVNPPPEEKREPAVSIRKSITPDHIVCLDDGKKFKSLRRHLTLLGMTPDQYRAKWSLPADYPMVAPNYAAQRSEMAKRIGLGQKRAEATPAKRGRKPKASA